MDNKLNEIYQRTVHCEDLRKRAKDKTQYAYLDLLYTLMRDYDELKNQEKTMEVAKEIEKIAFDVKTEEKNKVSEILLASYDTRARWGDFRAYCIALEWNRPKEKQFFLPRKRVLEKHGLIQAMQDMADDKLDFLFVSLPPRIGKNLSNSTPILTKNGWKKHGELEVGDYVLNDKGRFVRVLATSPEYPCNCRVTFSNGEQIDCHENHEWLVNDRHRNKELTLETKEMINKIRDNYNSNSTHNHFRFGLPFKEPVLGEYKELPVEPYTLGSFLGDGTASQNCITIDKNDKIIAETIGEFYPISNLYIHNIYGTHRYSFQNLRADLQKIGLGYSRKGSENVKHIPDLYLTASIEQRLQLLAGLLDTDGTLIKKEHRYHYTTTEKQLMEDFVSLVSTFGWRCSVTECEPRLSTSRIQGKKKIYTIGFNPTFKIPCRLERKQLTEFSKQRRITITNIENLDNCEMGKCIQVEGGVYLAGRTLIPTHNSTLGLFFLSFMAGLYPERSILGSGHSTSLSQSFYNEMLNLMTSEEYRYGEIFPQNFIINQSAEYSWIDLNHNKRFHTIMFKSIDGGTTGLAEASNILYCDDLIKDIEQANNPNRLDKIFYTYTSTIQDRKVQRLCKDGKYRPCPEIHIATRWSLNDVIGRLLAIYGEIDSERIKIINIPCYDENGESNFEYDYGKGFDKEYYHHLQLAEDPVIFSAKYLGQPIEREGRPFSEDQLTFYQELPDEKPDRILCYSDVAHGGEDYYSMPIIYQYGVDCYVEDVLFVNKLDDDKTRPLVVNKIMEHHVTKAGFEENNGGKLYADMVQRDLKQNGYRCNITTHKVPTTKSKLDRILSCQSEIKGIATEQGNFRIYFKSYEKRKDNVQYNNFMQNLYNWSQKLGSIQKTQHDDAPDSLAGLIINLLGTGSVGRASIKVSIDKLGL